LMSFFFDLFILSKNLIADIYKTIIFNK